MKKIVVFDLWHHEVAGGDNDGRWFADRGIMLVKTLGSKKAEIFFDTPGCYSARIALERLPEYLQSESVSPTNVVVISDNEKRLRQAKEFGCHTLAVSSDQKQTAGGDYSCRPYSDSITSFINLILKP